MSHAQRSRRRQLCRSQPQASQHKTYSRFIPDTIQWQSKPRSRTTVIERDRAQAIRD
jgi:hypothetical protein